MDRHAPGAQGAHARELQRGERFSFGSNWASFVDDGISAAQIELAQQSLRDGLGRADLEGLRFLDAGSGSGLFSLAAAGLGAQVCSFDYDPASVATTRRLHDRAGAPARWTVQAGSILDEQFLDGLGRFDVVYSWGVVHHTGNMWMAIEHLCRSVAPGGTLFLSIYNDQGAVSRFWRGVKRLYNAAPAPLQPVLAVAAALAIWPRRLLIGVLRGRPFSYWTDYARTSRGMNAWRDLVDWVGGYPFEVATPDAVFEFARTRGFRLERLKTVGGGPGCNEFVFRHVP